MSVSLRRKNISKIERKAIYKDLTFTPRNKNQRGQMVDGKPILFYKKGKKYIYVPFFYALSKKVKITQASELDRRPDLRFTRTLRDYQKPTTKKAWQQIQKYRTTLLNLPTAHGKTIIGAYIACKLKIVTAILLSSTALIEQWLETIKGFTTATTFVIDSKQKKRYNDEDIIIVMKGCLNRLGNSDIKKIKFLIIDEADTFCCKTGVEAILKISNVSHVMLQTATKHKQNGLGTILTTEVGEHEVWIPRTKPFKLIIIKTGIRVIRRYDKDGNFKWSDVISELSDDKYRNKLIIKHAVDMHAKICQYEPKATTLILSKEYDHALYLAKRSQRHYTSDYLAGNKSTIKDCDFLSGTLAKLARGFDINSHLKGKRIVVHAVITDTISDESLLAQTFGRAMRADNPIITIIVDEDPAILRHMRSTKKWAKNNGCTKIKIIDLTEEEV